MRIHHLQATAFGPFSDPVAIDFDTVSEAGLFLLCGPTGAGKTSVLDAICFGIYGEVPGARNSAKRLRSDHAAVGVAPSVLLEVSINARRFRIRRSPAWSRPKRRGPGATIEQARVTLEEKVEGSWVQLSNRLDETGHQMTELLGMNVTEFCQVAMLPQGRFQAFLRAKSGERHKVLQQLFQTSRFEDIEKWLVCRRQALRVANRTHQEKIASVVNRISEAAAVDVPSTWDISDLAVPAEEGPLAVWAADLICATAAAKTDVDQEVRAAAAAADEARASFTEAHRLLDLRALRDKAVRIEQSLSETADQADQARDRLDAARRATAVVPLLKLARDCDKAAEAAKRNLGEVLAEAARRLQADVLDLTHDDLALAERDAILATAAARTLLPREAELRSAQATVDSTTVALAEMDKAANQLQERCALVPVELARLRPVLAEQAALAATVTSVDQIESRLLGQLAAAEKLSSLQLDLAAAREQQQAAVDVVHALRERVHEVREARINGMAAELAAALAGGDSCPVCGSAEHPSVAGAVDGAPTRVEEEEARSAYEDAGFARQAHGEAVAALEKSCALAHQSAAGKSAHELRRDLDDSRRARIRCQQAAADEARLVTRIASLDDELAGLQDRVTDVRTRSARLAQERNHAQQVVDSVSVQLAALFEDEAVTNGVDRLIEEKSSAGVVFATARSALNARDNAVARSREASGQASDCAFEHRFDNCEDAASAALGQQDIEGLERLLRDRAARHTSAANVLSDSEVFAAVAVPTPDVEGLKLAVRSAEKTLAVFVGHARVIAGREERLQRLRTELEDELDAWAPSRCAYSSPRRSRPWSKARAVTTPSRCDSPRTSWPNGSRRLSPQPTSSSAR